MPLESASQCWLAQPSCWPTPHGTVLDDHREARPLRRSRRTMVGVAPTWATVAMARVQAALAHQAAEAGRDGVFLWDHMLLVASTQVPMVGRYRRAIGRCRCRKSNWRGALGSLRRYAAAAL